MEQSSDSKRYGPEIAAQLAVIEVGLAELEAELDLLELEMLEAAS